MGSSCVLASGRRIRRTSLRYPQVPSLRLYGTLWYQSSGILPSRRMSEGRSSRRYRVASRVISWRRGALKEPRFAAFSGAKTLSIEARIISPAARAFSRLRGGQSIMASPRTAKAMAPAGAAKTSRPVTLKHLAARLAQDHELTKREGEAILGDLVALITKHLKKGHS